MKNIQKIAGLYSKLHKQICNIFESTLGPGSLKGHNWEKEAGSGLTSVIRNGKIIEKGGVNYSFVRGDFTPKMKKLLNERAGYYWATGISSVMHPVNPHVPGIHMNIRYFALDNGTEWFGGGIDLTPHYIDVAEARSFHRSLRAICDKYDNTYYPQFKKWADDYFFLPHRNETRGVGGIFFDRLKPGEKAGFEKLLDFTLELGKAYPEIYKDILQKKSNLEYSDREVKWRQIRRGRYVEFILVYDRGTKFGFESSRNTESILISMPAGASWEYNHITGINSPEHKTLKLLTKGIDWVNYTTEINSK